MTPQSFIENDSRFRLIVFPVFTAKTNANLPQSRQKAAKKFGVE